MVLAKIKKIPKGEKSEKDIEKEKDENNKKKKQKNKKQGKDSQSEDEEDEMQKINGGQEAEVEHDIQILQKIVDEDLLYKNILGKFTPFILNIVTNIFTDNITDENKILYKTSIISLCKFMCVSKKFCEENLQILFRTASFFNSFGVSLSLKRLISKINASPDKFSILVSWI